jgi:hypothetical protein
MSEEIENESEEQNDSENEVLTKYALETERYRTLSQTIRWFIPVYTELTTKNQSIEILDRKEHVPKAVDSALLRMIVSSLNQMERISNTEIHLEETDGQ